MDVCERTFSDPDESLRGPGPESISPSAGQSPSDSFSDRRHDPFTDEDRLAIRARVARLIGRAGFTVSDRPDLQQELCFLLWRSWAAYDAQRGSVEALRHQVLKNGPVSLLRKQRAKKRCPGNGSPAPVGCDSIDHWTADDRAGNCRRLRGAPERSHEALAGLRHDVAHVLRRLTPRQRRICRMLPDRSRTEIATVLRISKDALRKEVNAIRAAFRVAGYGQLE